MQHQICEPRHVHVAKFSMQPIIQKMRERAFANRPWFYHFMKKGSRDHSDGGPDGIRAAIGTIFGPSTFLQEPEL